MGFSGLEWCLEGVFDAQRRVLTSLRSGRAPGLERKEKRNYMDITVKSLKSPSRGLKIKHGASKFNELTSLENRTLRGHSACAGTHCLLPCGSTLSKGSRWLYNSL